MQQRPLGRTGLLVTPVGLGLAAIGRPAYINLGRAAELPSDRGVESLRDRAHQLLDEAYAAGVRYFDAARSYGLAEEFLGSWLRRRDPLPEPVVCGSKWGYRYVGDWRLDVPVHEIKDHSLQALREQLPQSRALLGDQLRLYQVHSATLESGVLEDQRVLGALAELGREGLQIGLSVSGPLQGQAIERALAAQVDGVNPFGCVQATWNLLEPSAGGALQAASDAGWGVLVKEALANGRLAVEAGPELSESAVRHRVSWDAVGIAAALAQPWADCVLSGAVAVSQLRSNLRGAQLALTPAEVDQLLGQRRSAKTYWAERHALPWS